ncbi:MAG: hypothetical protein H6823_23045 [Planctomycetaceae bacterium]|nr:hypothetical protein [Planctomycetales bacterium]MCB9941120.1 hypothetical protein [Planctomycetaceae bacterium]
MQATRWRYLAVILMALMIGADRPEEQVSGKQALSKLQDYVGQWRGVGQVRRGSTQGAWSETSDWAWKFNDGKASLTFKVDDAKYFATGTLRAVDGDAAFELTAESENAKVTYVGRLDEDGSLVLDAADAPDGQPARISIRQVADGKRMLVLFERRVGDDRFLRMAEVGYTREGSNFGKGTNYIECVVTGGVGTMPVTFEGKTYYVCCTGCRDLFNDDPAAVLAEYRERKEAEKQK